MRRKLSVAVSVLLVLCEAYIVAAVKRTAVGVSLVMLAIWANARAAGKSGVAMSALLGVPSLFRNSLRLALAEVVMAPG